MGPFHEGAVLFYPTLENCPGDVSVRSSALDAARALQRAGIGGHPTAMATATGFLLRDLAF